jgi:hypothetical protein
MDRSQIYNGKRQVESRQSIEGARKQKQADNIRQKVNRR